MEIREEYEKGEEIHEAGDGRTVMETWEQVLEEIDGQCRHRGIPMLGPEKARFVAEWIERKRPERVVECGTGIGYSGLWIAATLRRLGRGRLITIELDPARAAEARANFERAGLADWVDARQGDAQEVLHTITEPVDFLLLDNDFGNYHPCFRAIEPRLTPDAVILADNVGIGAAGMADYLSLVRSCYPCETVWFDVNLPWLNRDAIEVTHYRRPG
jgi:predicted O-methyltransferase YrrM